MIKFAIYLKIINNIVNTIMYIQDFLPKQHFVKFEARRTELFLNTFIVTLVEFHSQTSVIEDYVIDFV